jgi:rod shape-determining protein MreD
MVLIYWCMALPHRVGIGVWAGWSGCCWMWARRAVGSARAGVVGRRLSDLQTYRRIRVFSPWRQALTVLVLLLIEQVLVFWISGVIGYPPRDWLVSGPGGGRHGCLAAAVRGAARCAPAFSGGLSWR